MPGFESSAERRESARLNTSLQVRIKFISSSVKDPALEMVYDGVTKNLSLGGLMLVCPLPRMEWLKDLLVGKILLGLNVTLPLNPVPIKMLTRVSWVEAIEEGAVNIRMGLSIQEIPGDHRMILSQYLMKASSVP